MIASYYVASDLSTFEMHIV